MPTPTPTINVLSPNVRGGGGGGVKHFCNNLLKFQCGVDHLCHLKSGSGKRQEFFEKSVS